MNRTHIIVIVTCTLICSACSTSVLYDPTLRMPARQLSTSEVQATAGWGLLPESRPEAVNGRQSDDAFLFDARAGLSKRVTLQARGWLGMDGVFDRSGVWGLAGLIQYAIDTASTGWRSVLQLGGGYSIYGSEVAGFGGSLTYIAYTPAVMGLQPYVGGGGILGFSTETLSDWGIAPMLHAGASWEFIDNVGITAEVTSVFQINVTEEVFHTIITPTVTFYIQL